VSLLGGLNGVEHVVDRADIVVELIHPSGQIRWWRRAHSDQTLQAPGGWTAFGAHYDVVTGRMDWGRLPSAAVHAVGSPVPRSRPALGVRRRLFSGRETVRAGEGFASPGTAPDTTRRPTVSEQDTQPP